MVERKADAWETTQETAWAVMALTDWMVTSGELNPNYTYEAQFNGETLTQGTATRDNVRDSVQLQVQVSDMLAQEVNNLVIGRTDGSGVLYYTAHLRLFLPVPQVEELDSGIIVERRYTLPGSNEPITAAQVGDNVQVQADGDRAERSALRRSSKTRSRQAQTRLILTSPPASRSARSLNSTRKTRSVRDGAGGTSATSSSATRRSCSTAPISRRGRMSTSTRSAPDCRGRST